MKKIKLILQNKKFLKLPLIDWLVILTGVIIYAIITFATIAKSSIWFDESFGAYLTQFNFFDIAYYTAFDVHPPLYYWFLKIWEMFFGHTEIALRSMSVLFGCIAIIFGYLLTKKLFNRKAACLSLLFLIISPMLVRYGQEARMYTLVTAIALAATYTLVIALQSKRKLPWVIYGILIALGLWTHYFIAIVWATHWLWRAGNIYRENKGLGRKVFLKKFFSKEWKLAHFVALGVFALWLPFFLMQVFTIQAFGFWIPPVDADTITNFLTNVIFYLDSNQVTGWLAGGLITLLATSIALSIRVYKKQTKEQKQKYRLIIDLAFFPIILLFIMSLPPMRSYFIDRYLLTAAIFIAIFMGTTFALSLKTGSYKKIKYLLVIILAGFMIFGVSNVYKLGNYSKDSNNSNNTRDIIDAVKTKSDGSVQPIITATPWLFYEAVFYTTPENPVYYIEPSEYKYGSLKMLENNDQSKIKNIIDFTTEYQTIWYVGCPAGEPFSAPYDNWQELQEVTVNDSVNGKPLYKAIQYQVSN